MVGNSKKGLSHSLTEIHTMLIFEFVFLLRSESLGERQKALLKLLWAAREMNLLPVSHLIIHKNTQSIAGESCRQVPPLMRRQFSQSVHTE